MYEEVTHGRSFGKHDQDVCKLHVEHNENLNLKLIEISSTPWHGAVDQDWRSKLHAPNCTRQPPDWTCTGPPEHAQLFWQGCPLTLGSKPCRRLLLDLTMIISPGAGYTTTEAWTGISTGI